MREQKNLSQQEIISTILQIGHGDYSIYEDIGLAGAKQHPNFFAHLLSWNLRKGEVRDSKVALPILALRGPEFHEHAVACLCQLSPRDILKGVRYNKGLVPAVTTGAGSLLKKGVRKYLKSKRGTRWNKMVLQDRASVKSLYALFHIRPNSYEQNILFKKKYPSDSVFQIVRDLPKMEEQEAAGAILNNNIPFLTLTGALKNLKNSKDLMLALVERMSGSELINNTKALKIMGALNDSAIRSVYNRKIEEIHRDTSVASLKSANAATVVRDAKLKKKFNQVAEEKLDSIRIEGDWLVLADKSYSMTQGIELGKQIAALIARSVKGKVHLVFFDTNAYGFDVSGLSLEEIQAKTRGILPGGATSISIGLKVMAEKKVLLNGIAVVSDGGENTGSSFGSMYKEYEEKMLISPTTYFFRLKGDSDVFSNYCANYDVDIVTHDIDRNVDYYSLPNLIRTMKSSRFSLIDEIMESKLFTLEDI